MELDKRCFPLTEALFCLMGFRLAFFLTGFESDRGETSGSLNPGFLDGLLCSSSGALADGGGLELGERAVGEWMS